MSLSEWLQQKANAASLEACDRALSRFRAAADADAAYRLQVAETVWTLLLSTALSGEDPDACLAEIRAKATRMDPEALGLMTRKLLDDAPMEGRPDTEAGKLVACWLKAIALEGDACVDPGRARHVVRAYEKTFSTLARLMDRAAERSGKDP